MWEVFDAYAKPPTDGTTPETSPEPVTYDRYYKILLAYDYGSSRFDSFAESSFFDIASGIENQFPLSWGGERVTNEQINEQDSFRVNNQPADILYYIGHGLEYGGVVIPSGDGYSTVPMEAGDIGKFDNRNADGGRNFKWVVLYSCHSLNMYSGFQHSFTTDNDSVHTILGFRDAVSVWNAEALLSKFTSKVFDGEPVLNAWINSMIKDWGFWEYNYSEDWSAFYLEEAKEETIFNPIEDFTNYYVWYVDFDIDEYTYVSNSTPIINDPIKTDPPTTPGEPDDPRILSVTSPSTTIISDNNVVSTSLENDLITLNYTKPNSQLIYNLISSPEVEDYQTFEQNFYQDHNDDLPLLYNVRKTEHLNMIEYEVGGEHLFYFIPTGSVTYQRKGAENFIASAPFEETLIDDVILTAENFMTEYGGGIPTDLTEPEISVIRHRNLTTGQNKIESFLIFYPRRYITTG